MPTCTIKTDDDVEVNGFSDNETQLTEALFIGGNRDGEIIELTSELLCTTKIGKYIGSNYQFIQDKVKYVFTLFIYEGTPKEVIEEKCRKIDITFQEV